MDVESVILQKVGFLPVDPYSWMYACRGLYQAQEYEYCLEGLSHCSNHPPTRQESAHIRSFCLIHLGRDNEALMSLRDSVRLGNEEDWHPLVELLMENVQSSSYADM
jgi:hypothetical protein